MSLHDHPAAVHANEALPADLYESAELRHDVARLPWIYPWILALAGIVLTLVLAR